MFVEELDPPLDEKDIQIGAAVPDGVALLEPGFEGGVEALLADVGGVAHHHVEAAGGENFGKSSPPVEGPVADGGIVHEGVAAADRTAQSGQGAARAGGGEPEAQAGDLAGLFVDIHTVEIALEDLLFDLFVGGQVPETGDVVPEAFMLGDEEAQRLVEKGAAPAGGIADLEILEPVAVGAQVLQGRFFGGFEALGIGGGVDLGVDPQLGAFALTQIPEGAFEDVAGDPFGGVEDPLFFALARVGVVLFAPQCGVHLLQVAEGVLEDVPQDIHRHVGSEIVVAELLSPHIQRLVADDEGIELRILGEEPAVVSGDLEPVVPLGDGLEVELVDVVEGEVGEFLTVELFADLPDGVFAQQPRILGEEDKNDPIDQLLGQAQQAPGVALGIAAAQVVEEVAAEGGVVVVEFAGDLPLGRFALGFEAHGQAGGDAFAAEQQMEQRKALPPHRKEVELDIFAAFVDVEAQGLEVAQDAVAGAVVRDQVAK